MANKGVLSKDIFRLDNYRVTIDGVDYMCIRVGGIEHPIKVVDLPDGTRASGGRNEAGEFEIEIAESEEKEREFFLGWEADCKDPIPPSAYKTVTVTRLSNSGANTSTEDRVGCFVSNVMSNEMSFEDGSEAMSTLVITVQCDDTVRS